MSAAGSHGAGSCVVLDCRGRYGQKRERVGRYGGTNRIWMHCWVMLRNSSSVRVAFLRASRMRKARSLTDPKPWTAIHYCGPYKATVRGPVASRVSANHGISMVRDMM